MKADIRIPSMQYGYIELHVDEEIDEIVRLHNEVARQFEEGEGLNVKDWAQLRDTYLNTGEIDVEKWEQCSLKQKGFINEIKKTIEGNNRKSKNE